MSVIRKSVAGARQHTVADECQLQQQPVKLKTVLRGQYEVAGAPQQGIFPLQDPLNAPAQKQELQELLPGTRRQGASHTPAIAQHTQPPPKQQSSSTSTAKLLQLVQQSRKLLLSGKSTGRDRVSQSHAVHTRDHMSSNRTADRCKAGNLEVSAVLSKFGKPPGVSAEHEPLQRGGHIRGGQAAPGHVLHCSAEQ